MNRWAKPPVMLLADGHYVTPKRARCLATTRVRDALIYRFRGDPLAGRIDRSLLEQILRAAGTYEDDAARTVSIFESLPHPKRWNGFIHPDRRSPLSGKFDRYGSRLVAIYNYFQAALTLFADYRIEAAAVVRVAVEMVDRQLHYIEALRNSLQDLWCRPHRD